MNLPVLGAADFLMSQETKSEAGVIPGERQDQALSRNHPIEQSPAAAAPQHVDNDSASATITVRGETDSSLLPVEN
jgi:hypothetical protein